MFRISFCFVVVMTFAVTSATYADLSDGLVSYWTFDDTLADQTGGNDGTFGCIEGDG